VVLPVLWVICALVIIWAAVRSRHHADGLRTGRFGVAVLYVAAGAAVNGFFLLRGDDYANFADHAYVPFVRHTWRNVVVPNRGLFISLLIVFELAVGLLVISGGRWTQLAYSAAIAFHIALLAFGWGFFLWSGPMIAALVTLLRHERTSATARLGPTPVGSRSGSRTAPADRRDRELAR
jgi:hypothetical protein